MTLEFLTFLFVGKLLIYLTQQFPFIKVPFISWFFENENQFFPSLIACDLCLGTWLYPIINLILFKQDLLNGWGFVHINIISEIITGMIAAFVMHLLSIGWKIKFGVFEVK